MNTPVKSTARRRIPFLSIVLGVAAMCAFFVGSAFAADMDVGQVASHITGSMSDLARLITAGSYVAGFGFAVGSILKFKQHKDNPTQIPIGTPIALMFVAAGLIFLPQIFGITGTTMFGGGATQGTTKGVDTFSQ